MPDRARDFTLRYVLEATPEAVYKAVATREGIAGWWTTDTSYDDQLGSVAHMRFPGNGFYATMKVIALEPNHLVHWQCIDSQHPPNTGFADLKDWVGTEVRFEIGPVNDRETQLVFTHIGLGPLECREVCSSIWSFYLGTSLREMLETGSGQPHREGAQQ